MKKLIKMLVSSTVIAISLCGNMAIAEDLSAAEKIEFTQQCLDNYGKHWVWKWYGGYWAGYGYTPNEIRQNVLPLIEENQQAILDQYIRYKTTWYLWGKPDTSELQEDVLKYGSAFLGCDTIADDLEFPTFENHAQYASLGDDDKEHLEDALSFRARGITP